MMRRRPPKLPEGDDGRTIVDMNVDGMPWVLKRRDETQPSQNGDQMTPAQRRAWNRAAVRAGLAVAFVFGSVFALFIAFCDFVWFK